MGFDGDFSFLGTSLKVFFIDLLLSGDNAVVIALACRTLPANQMRKAILIGTGVAILLRVYLTTVVAYLLEIPCLKLVGAGALIVIAIKLIVVEDKQGAGTPESGSDGKQSLDLWTAVFIVVIADVIMSLDNVVALAAVAQGSIFFLSLGLVLSIPLLMFGSMFVAALLKRYPILITAGGALLGWIAGEIGVSDPMIADWMTVQAPALAVAMPLLVTIFVLLESRVVEDESKQANIGGITMKRCQESAGTSPHPRDGDGTKATIETVPLSLDPNLHVDEKERAAVLIAADGAAPPSAGEIDLVASLVRTVRRTLFRKTPPSPPIRTLPVYSPPAIDEAAAAGALILLAEDNPIDQGAIKRTLEQLGYAVDVAHDGAQALAMLSHRSYGLLITDFDMPNMDGFALATRIRADERTTGRRLPIIGLAGYVASMGMPEKCRVAGMDDCLTKPASIDRLEALVTHWLPVAEGLRRKKADVLDR